MNKLVKGTAALLALPLLKLYRHTVVKLLKNEALEYYVKTIKTARKLFVAVVGFFVCLGLLVSGFVMVHIGAFMYVSIYLARTELALLIFSVLGMIYMFVAMIVLFIASSEKTWLKASKYNEIVEKKF